MKRTNVKLTLLIMLASLLINITSCSDSRNSATIGNSTDTTSVNRAGGPPIRDTSTVTQDRKDSVNSKKGSSSAKGNADPSGRIKNQ